MHNILEEVSQVNRVENLKITQRTMLFGVRVKGVLAERITNNFNGL